MELNWNCAEEWLKVANKDKFDKNTEPVWSWDVNFKLDFDGSLLSISSRFYPPRVNNSDSWQGVLQVLLLGDVIMNKEFKASSLNEIRDEAESFVKEYIATIKNSIVISEA